MEETMQEFSHHMSEMVDGKYTAYVTPFLSQYTVWLIISAIVCLIVVVYAAKKVQLIPKGFFAGGIDHLMEWARQDIGYNVIGPDADKHMPFIMTILFFILTANLIGLIPGVSVATGCMGVTGALAVISFIYFMAYGFKRQGFWGYIKSFAPEGLVFPLAILLWVIEVFSTFLRIVTLAVRLFGNMFAGHLAMGAFAILATVFTAPFIQSMTAATFAGALPSVAWIVLLLAMYCMEMLVACVQAYVFTLLSAVYISLAAGH